MAGKTDKAFGLDTSGFLRLLIGEPADQAEKAKRLLSETVTSGQRAAVSDLVLSETYFALQHHYEVPKKEAIEALRIASASGELICSENAKRILSQKDLHRAKPGFVDRLIHAEYASRNRQMITFEKSAQKLEDALVL